MHNLTVNFGASADGADQVLQPPTTTLSPLSPCYDLSPFQSPTPLCSYLFTWHKMDTAKPFNWPPLQNPRAFGMSLIKLLFIYRTVLDSV